MTADVTDLKAARFKKRINSFNASVNPLFEDERQFFLRGKFLPFAQGYIESGFADDRRPTFHVTVEFRDYFLDEAAKNLVTHLAGSGFEIEKQNFSKAFLRRIKSGEAKPDHANAYGPFATRQVEFDEALRILANREDGNLGAYQPSLHGFRQTSIKNYDKHGIGFNVVCCGYDARRGRFEEHVVDDQTDVEELCAMMSEIRASFDNEDDDVVAFRRR